MLAFIESGMSFFASCRAPCPQCGTADHEVYIPRVAQTPGAEPRSDMSHAIRVPMERYCILLGPVDHFLVELFLVFGAVDARNLQKG